MALIDNLRAYYPLDELGGTRKEILSGSILTDYNSVLRVPGKIGWAGQFTATASQMLYDAGGDNASLGFAGSSFTIAAWTYLDHDTTNLARTIVSKWNNTASPFEREYMIRRSGTGFAIYISTTGSDSPNIVTNQSASSIKWYFVIARHDTSTSILKIMADDDYTTSASSSLSGSIADGTAPFRIGAHGDANALPTNFMRGRIGPVMLWNRAITDAEATTLYNGGDGFDFLANNPRLRILTDWNLVPDLAGFIKNYSISRGRSSNLDRVGTGTATIVADDSTKTFLPLNTSGSLSGSLLPGRTIRIQWDYSGSTIKRFTGKTISFTPEPTIAGGRDTTIVCSDEMENFQRRETRSTLYSNIYSGCLIGSILDNAQFPSASRTLDAGQDIYEYAHFDRRKIDEVLVDIIQTEYGNGYIRGDGYYVFHDRYYRSKTSTAAASFNEGMLGITFRRDADDLRTEARVSISPKVVQSEGTIWTLQDPISISASSTASWFGNYVDPTTCQLCAAGGVASPAIGTGVLLNSNASGTGTNLSASLSACVTVFAEAFKAVASNGGATNGYITMFNMIGCPIISYEQISRTAIDATACALYGTRTLTYDAPLMGNADKAQQFAQFLVTRYSDIANVDKVTMTLVNDNATHWEQILRRELDDRIAVTASAVAISGQDYFIGNLSETYTATTGEHEAMYTLERFGIGDAFFLVDSDVVGGIRGLGY